MSEKFKGIYYQCSGKQSQPAVLFLHGFLGNGGDWQEIVKRVSGNFFCILVDLPGHGFSNNIHLLKDVWNFDSLSQRLDEFLNFLSLKKVYVSGYSLGGRLAMHFALRYSNKVAKLVLESSSPGIKNNGERTARLQEDLKLADKIRKSNIHDFIDQWYEQPVFNGIKQHPKYVDLINSKIQNDNRLLAKALSAFSIGRQSFLGNKVARLKIPVLLVCGEKDIKYVEIMKSIKQQNEAFKLSVIKQCGHNVHFEKPNLFAEHLAEFLSL